jgi:transporter family protein
MRADGNVIALTVLVILLWGAWGFFGKVALSRGMPPLSVFSAEVAVGFLLGAALLGVLLAGGQPLPWQRPWNLFGVLSGAAMAVGLLLYYLALEKSPASAIVPLTGVYPVVTVLLSLVFLSERLAVAQWVGVVLVVAGVLLLLSQPVAR